MTTGLDGDGALSKRAVSVAIVGGGVTGLATAYYMEQAAAGQGWDLNVTLVEREQRLGGKLLTVAEDGFLVEAGPDSVLTQKPWALGLARELGMEEEIVFQQIDGVFLLHRGRLHRIPPGVVGMVPTRPMALLKASFISWRGKLRAGLEPFVRARRDGVGESLREFLGRRLGDEVAQTLVEPFTAGVYAGDPRQLGVRELFPTLVEWEQRHGSLTRGIRAARKRATGAGPARPFASLRGGMATLARAIESNLRAVTLRSGARATSLTRERLDDRPVYRLSLEGGDSIIADYIVLATPAHAAAPLLEGLAPKAASLLKQSTFASTATVTLAFRRRSVGHALNGSGFLVPRTEPSLLTGCTWSSAKWAGRAPKDWVLLRAFVGWAGDDSFMGQDDPTLVRSVTDQLRPLLDLEGSPEKTWVHRWPNAMPQYGVGHGDWTDAVDEATADCPGLLLAGASYRGIGVPDCIRQAKEAVERIEHLVTQGVERPSSDIHR